MTSNTSLKDTKGASSILVIIMMVVLLVFGLAVLTTSLSNVRLGERKRAWLSEYYQLEGASFTEIAAIDTLLLKAEAEARAYIETDDYMDDYMMDGPLVGSQKQEVFALAYNDAVGLLVSQAIAGKEDAVLRLATPDIDLIHSGEQIEKSTLTYSISLPTSNYNKHLQIALDLLQANPENITEDFRLITRYQIVRHTQQQEAFVYDEGIDFDDPFDEDATGANPFDE